MDLSNDKIKKLIKKEISPTISNGGYVSVDRDEAYFYNLKEIWSMTGKEEKFRLIILNKYQIDLNEIQ